MSQILKAETPAYSGDLTISVTSSLGFIPIDNATITISYSAAPESVVQTLTTNDSGLTDTISLPAPNLSYSTEISDVQPYSEYDISVTAPAAIRPMPYPIMSQFLSLAQRYFPMSQQYSQSL